MIVGIHQPNFAPWAGFFNKMRACDTFVLLDDVAFSKGSYTNRVRVSGDRWLTVPVHTRLGTRTCDVSISDKRFPRRHAGILESEYGKSPIVDEFADVEESALSASENLADFNIAVLAYLRTKLSIDTPLIRSSTLQVTGSATSRLVAIVRQLRGSAYLSGTGGRNYQDESLFHEAGIEVKYVQRAMSPSNSTVGYSILHGLLRPRDLPGATSDLKERVTDGSS
jgi:hypothetical protein